MANDGIIVPGEGEATSLSPSEQVEQSARKKGWKPQEEFQGDPSDWVPAQEFVGRQKLYDTIHDLKRQMNRQASKFEKDFQQVAGYLANVRKEAYEKAMKDLEAKHLEAIRNEDPETATQVAREMAEKAAEKVASDAAERQQQQVQSPATTEEFNQWRQENQWFDKNSEMQEDALSIGIGYAAKNPNSSQSDVLKHVTEKIKKIYPEQFEAAPKSGKERTSSVEPGSGNLRGGSTPRGKKKLTVADLEPDQVSIMRTLIKRGALKELAAKNKRTQEEEYLAQMQDL